MAPAHGPAARSLSFFTASWYCQSGSLTLSNLTNITGSSFIVSGGATLSLPSITSYTGWANHTTTLEATDANSQLTFAKLASITEDTSAANSLIQVEALAGGLVAMPKLTQISGGPVLLESDGASSDLEVAALANFSASAAGQFYRSTIQVTNGGTLEAGSLTGSLANVNLAVGGTGMNVTFARVTSLAGSSVTVSGGATLDLPGVTSFSNWPATVSLLPGTVTIGSTVISMPGTASTPVVNIPVLPRWTGSQPGD